MKKFLVINGPNINMLGIREPNLYGKENYQSLISMIRKWGKENNIEIECYQSNHEGDIVDKIQEAYGKIDGIVINPAAYTHTSVAILDALKAVKIPAVEVHITDINKRDEFRKVSYAGQACFAHVIGEGLNGYIKALELLKQQNEIK